MFSSFISCLFFVLLSSMVSEVAYAQDTFCFWDLRQDVLLKDELHYLNVPSVGTYTIYDVFDCTFECLSNPFCLSLNLAASKGADGKMWCELLSSTKYSKSEEFKGNESSHHLSVKTPRLSSCRNGGTCVPNYRHRTFECKCREGFIGEYCEIVGNSCKELYDAYKSRASQVVTIYLDSKPTSILCHLNNDFGCGDGPWTPVMKIDGSKRTFHYDSSFWSNKEFFNLAGGETGFDSQETKLPTYWNTSFSKLCLGMKVSQGVNFLVMNKQASSLFSLIADGQYRSTSLGRSMWKSLLGSAGSLQLNCNKEGLNTRCARGSSSTVRARIGIISNNENSCSGCDSRIGFGTGGPQDDSNTCGNEAMWFADNGDKHIKTFGYILVQ